MQEEDTSGGFKYGGWTAPYGDKSFGEILKKELSVPFDLLLGGKTYEIFSAYWPNQTGFVADPFNNAKKYVVSNSGAALTWKESILIDGDVAAKIKAFKRRGWPGASRVGEQRTRANTFEERPDR